jgi:hypothetical protein
MNFESLLDSALEHSAHAWRDLERRDIIDICSDDGPWPPEIAHSRSGNVDYHLAAMIKYIKQAYDQLNKITEIEHESG